MQEPPLVGRGEGRDSGHLPVCCLVIFSSDVRFFRPLAAHASQRGGRERVKALPCFLSTSLLTVFFCFFARKKTRDDGA